MRFLFTLVAISFLSFVLHPIHVSVCDIEFDKEENRLEMTMRLFTDDLEKQIREETGEMTMDILNPPDKYTTDQLFLEYFQKHFSVSLNGEKADYKYLGHEVESGSVYCYLMVTNVESINSISAFNDILIRTFDDQVNLIHVEIDNDIHSMMFRKGQLNQSLSFGQD